ncbi:MAG: thioredoxin domain-containing protein [Phycisphaerales bacterium]|nr:MAG: thioredoxin domain-containing protein [Phycisphaerales bacterium]
MAIIALALTGAWVSGTLLKEHDGGWHHGQRGTAFLLQLCESQTIPSASCADVVGSRWGSFDFYIGSRRVLIPASLIGLVYFASLAIWFSLTDCVSATRWIWCFTAFVISCGLAGSLFFTGVMAFSVEQWCPLCVVAHTLNGAVFVCMLWIWGSRRVATAVDPGSSTDEMSGLLGLRRKLAFSAVAVAGMASVGLCLYFDAMSEVRRQWRKLAGVRQVLGSLQNDPEFVLREYFAQPLVEMPTRVAGGTSEAPDATDSNTRLVIFTDYDCNPCACFDGWRELLVDAAFDYEVQVEIRHLPLTLEEMGFPRDDSGGRQQKRSLPPSYAAEAARLQDGGQSFEKMHRLLFEHRRDLPTRDYPKLARDAGLDVQRFLTDLSDERLRRIVQDDVALAETLGVSTVPAVFLNNRRVPDVCLESVVFWRSVAGRFSEKGVLALAEPVELITAE